MGVLTVWLHHITCWNDDRLDITREHEHHPARTANWLPHMRKLERAAEMFRALADPLRLRLLARPARPAQARREAVICALADEHVLLLVRSAIDHAMERVLPTS